MPNEETKKFELKSFQCPDGYFLNFEMGGCVKSLEEGSCKTEVDHCSEDKQFIMGCSEDGKSHLTFPCLSKGANARCVDDGHGSVDCLLPCDEEGIFTCDKKGNGTFCKDGFEQDINTACATDSECKLLSCNGDQVFEQKCTENQFCANQPDDNNEHAILDSCDEADNTNNAHRCALYHGDIRLQACKKLKIADGSSKFGWENITDKKNECYSNGYFTCDGVSASDLPKPAEKIQCTEEKKCAKDNQNTLFCGSTCEKTSCSEDGKKIINCNELGRTTGITKCSDNEQCSSINGKDFNCRSMVNECQNTVNTSLDCSTGRFKTCQRDDQGIWRSDDTFSRCSENKVWTCIDKKAVVDQDCSLSGGTCHESDECMYPPCSPSDNNANLCTNDNKLVWCDVMGLQRMDCNKVGVSGQSTGICTTSDFRGMCVEMCTEDNVSSLGKCASDNKSYSICNQGKVTKNTCSESESCKASDPIFLEETTCNDDE